MSKQKIKAAVFVFVSLIASFLLVEYVFPNLNGVFKTTIIAIIMLSSYLLSEKIFPTGQTKKEHITKGIIPITSYMIAWVSSELIEGIFERSNYNLFANVERYGIDKYNLQILTTSLMAVLIFLIIYRVLLKLYHYFENSEKTN